MRKNLLVNEKLSGYLFILPNLVLYLLFFIIPFLATIILSFTEWGLMLNPKFIGLSNYIQLLKSPVFYKTLINTLYFSFSRVVLTISVAFGVALLLNRKIKGIVFFRTIYFLPYVSLLAAVAIVWNWLYQGDGLINYFLGLLGIQGPAWLVSEVWAMPAIIIMSSWKDLGYCIVIFLAAFQGIPKRLYEAATIDGANWYHKIRYITIPLSTHAIFFTIITTIIGTMQAFDQFYLMTKGGPANATTTLPYFIYKVGFEWFEMGYASAVSMVLFSIIMGITIMQWIIRKKWVFE